MVIYWGYLGHILGISCGYLGDIWGLSWKYLGDIFCENLRILWDSWGRSGGYHGDIVDLENIWSRSRRCVGEYVYH